MEKSGEGVIMPRSTTARDFDLYLQEDAGMISKHHMKAEILKRDIKDLKKEPFYLAVFLLLLSILGVQFGISIYILSGLCVYPLLNSVFSSWIKLAEMETEIKYLESGLELIR